MRKKIGIKIFSCLLVTLLLLNLVPVQYAMAINAGSGSKENSFVGYRYLNTTQIQVWADKNIGTTFYPGQFKIYEGTDPSTGRQIAVAGVAGGVGSNVTSPLGLSGGGSVIITSAEQFVPGNSYSIVVTSTIKSNNGLTLGHFNNHQDIVFSFAAPDTQATPNVNGTYSASIAPTVNYWPANNATNVPVERLISFSLNVPMDNVTASAFSNWAAKSSTLGLEKNGVPLNFDWSINTTKDGSIYAPIVSDDRTLVYFPMTAGGQNTSYNLDFNTPYTLDIPEIHLINGQTIPAQKLNFTTTADDVPAAFSSLPTTSTTGDNLSISWQTISAVTNVSPAATGYNVWASTDPYFNFVKLNATPISAPTPPYVVTSLQPSTSYYFRVTAVNGSAEGGFSDYVQATTPADTIAPTWPIRSLTATDISRQNVTLNWAPATDNYWVTAYQIYANGSLIATVNGDATSYTVQGLDPCTPYNFKVEAGDNAGNLSTDGPTVAATTSVDLGLPEPTTVTVSPDTKITLDPLIPVTQQFSAVIRDQYDAVLDGQQVTWSVYKNPLGVSIDSSGLLTVQPVASLGQVMVTATVYGTKVSGSRQFGIDTPIAAPLSSTTVDDAIYGSQNTTTVTLPACPTAAISLDSGSITALNTADKTVALATYDTTFELKISDLNLGGTNLSDITQFQIGRKTVDNTTNAQLTSGNTLSNLSGGTFQVLGTTFQLDAVAQLSGGQQQVITNFNHPITVRIPVSPVTLASNQYIVACWFNTDTGKWEEMGPAVYSNGLVTFTTNHFSNWATMVKTVSGDGGGSGSSDNGSGSGSGPNSDDPMAGRKPLNFVGAYLTTISNNTSTTGESVTGSTTVPVKPTIKLYFDKNIVSDLVWNENKLCFSMQDSARNNVPIEVTRISDQDNFNERQNVFITPVNDLTKGKTYKILVNPNLLAKNLNSHLSDTTNGQGVKITFQVEIPQLDQFKVSNDGKISSVVIDEKAENWQNVDLYTALGGSVSSGRLVIPKALVAKSATTEIPLRVKFDTAEIRVPMTVLASYSSQDKDVAIDIERLPQLGNVKGQANETFNSTGNLYSVKFYLLESDGKSSSLNLSTPVEVRMAVDTAKMSQERIDGLGLYVLDDTTKEWRYLGGVVEDKNFVSKTTVSGTMAVWSYERTFSDLNGHWAAKDINYLAKKHIANGVNLKEFKPNANVTRAEFAVLLARLLDLKPSTQAKFSDVNSSGWYAGMVNAAAEAGLVSGFNGKFRPTDKISREEMALLIVKAYKLKGKTIGNKTSTTSQFKDGSTVSGWARDSVDQAVQLGIIKGSNDSTFGPGKKATRAEAFVVVKRLLEQVG